jgi:glycerophosphoryl diester phosphodiesterase
MTFQSRQKLTADALNAALATKAAAAGLDNAGIAYPGIAGITEVIAHRGFANYAPENTIEACAVAAVLGCRSFECDVQITSDGVPIVMHDATVDRTTNGTGTVASLTSAYIAGLTVDLNGTATVPTFAAWLAFAKTRASNVYPEIKGYRTQADIDLMLAAVVAAGMESVTTFQSFTLSDLQYLRSKNATVGVALLGSDIGNLAALAALGGRTEYWLDYTTVLANPAWVSSIAAAGVKLACWTVDSTASVQQLGAIGVTRIVTNGLDQALIAQSTAAVASGSTLQFKVAGAVVGSLTATITSLGGTSFFADDSGTRLLQVYTGTAALQGGAFFTRWNASGLGSVIALGTSKSDTPGTHSILANNDSLGQLKWNGSDGATFQRGASITATVNGTPATGQMPTKVDIGTSPGAGGVVTRLTLDAKGNNVLGGTTGGALATTATDGFAHIPTMAGTPTGTPTTYTGRAPMVVDTTGSKLWVWTGAAWKSATLA